VSQIRRGINRPGRNASLCPRSSAWRELRYGDGPLSVRVRPSSLKRDRDRRATRTGEKCLVNVHAKSRMTPELLRTLRSEYKDEAGACPDRTRAIPCTVRAAMARVRVRSRWRRPASTISSQAAVCAPLRYGGSGRRIGVFLVILKQPAAARRRHRHRHAISI
jgi:hypothetical protein